MNINMLNDKNNDAKTEKSLHSNDLYNDGLIPYEEIKKTNIKKIGNNNNIFAKSTSNYRVNKNKIMNRNNNNYNTSYNKNLDNNNNNKFKNTFYESRSTRTKNKSKNNFNLTDNNIKENSNKKHKNKGKKKI